jgi:tetratricopeptide (TPR) repeat protein
MRLEGSGLGKLKDYQAIRINGGDDFFFKLDDLRQRFLTARAGSLLQPLSEVAGEAALKEKIAARDQPEVGLEQLTAQEYFERAFPRTDDWPERIRLFGEAIRCDPSFAEAYKHRGWSRLQIGDYSGAVSDYAEMTRLEAVARLPRL